jgi:MFS family permease
MWADLAAPEAVRATSLAVGLFFVQQFSGINAVVFFSNSVFRSAGVTSDTLASAAVGLVNVLTTAAAAQSLDARGRRPLLLASFAGMALSMAVLAASLTLPALAPLAVPLSVGGTLVYIASFAAGVGPVPSLLVAELFPPTLRGKGQSAAMLSHWLCAIAIGQCFLPAVQAYGVGAVYAFFSSICLIGFLVVGRYVPETKGRSYVQVAALIQAGQV